MPLLASRDRGLDLNWGYMFTMQDFRFQPSYLVPCIMAAEPIRSASR
jgi:hypothetical protein